MATEAETVPNLQASTPVTEADPTSAPSKTEDVKSTEPVASDKLPSPETISKSNEYTVLDHKGEKHTFKSLYDGPDSSSRTLIIFIRHFFCGVSNKLHISTKWSCNPSKNTIQTCQKIYTNKHPELSRIHLRPLKSHNTLRPTKSPNTHLPHHNRLRRPRPHRLLRQRNIMSIPHLCRPSA